MVKPGLLVDAKRHLHEDREVLRAQRQLSFRPAEDEGVRELALGVLAPVPPVLGLARDQLDGLDLAI